MLSAELPLPGAAIGLGLKLAVTPVGRPAAVSDTAELKPLLTDVEIVVLPELPCVTDSPGGVAVTVKVGCSRCVNGQSHGRGMGSAATAGRHVTFEVPVVAVLLDEKVRVGAAAPRR